MTKNPEKLARVATISALCFIATAGFLMTLFEIKPFWVDEWRIIYNLKTRPASELWGTLDLMQQFPRVYLQVFKFLTECFDYSYSALRGPSFVVGMVSLVFVYRLGNRIYKRDGPIKYLFPLILIASHTYVLYLVQIKQYTMDILLSLVVLWQLLQLLALRKRELSWGKFMLYVFALVVAPFFSYSYPILVAPLFAVAMLQSVLFIPGVGEVSRGVFLVRVWLPLLLCLSSIGVFYTMDVAQLMKDEGMKTFWQSMMMLEGFKPLMFLRSCYLIFSNVGSGFVFEIIFGVTGLAAFFYAAAKGIRNFRDQLSDEQAQLRSYSIILLVTILGLHAIGKLPIGEPRLVCYAVPAISILIIYLLGQLRGMQRFSKPATYLIVVLFLGTIGNIINSPVKDLTSKRHKKLQGIYNNVTKAINTAGEKHIPIFVAAEIAFPDQKVIEFPNTDIRADILCFTAAYEKTPHFNAPGYISADWIVKTYPSYKIKDARPVYGIDDINKAHTYAAQLGNVRGFVAVNDTTFIESSVVK